MHKSNILNIKNINSKYDIYKKLFYGYIMNIHCLCIAYTIAKQEIRYMR